VHNPNFELIYSQKTASKNFDKILVGLHFRRFFSRNPLVTLLRWRLYLWSYFCTWGSHKNFLKVTSSSFLHKLSWWLLLYVLWNAGWLGAVTSPNHVSPKTFCQNFIQKNRMFCLIWCLPYICTYIKGKVTFLTILKILKYILFMQKRWLNVGFFTYILCSIGSTIGTYICTSMYSNA
jgi:hypothetical protein